MRTTRRASVTFKLSGLLEGSNEGVRPLPTQRAQEKKMVMQLGSGLSGWINDTMWSTKS